MKGIFFEKVSFEEFKSKFDGIDEDVIKNIYYNIKMPSRSTKCSAGYDFFAPLKIVIEPGKEATIPTGIRVKMPEDVFLAIFPRSGLGFKYRLQLNNTVGIIDSDYYFSDNEGHIMAKLTNDTKENKVVVVDSGKAFCQGIFMNYLLTEDDNATGIRNGGFGSTDKKEN